VIPAVPIIASLLAILDDDNEVELGERFQRAVAFNNPDLFWDHVPEKDTDAVLDVLIPHLIETFRPYSEALFAEEPEITRSFGVVKRVIDINGQNAGDVILKLAAILSKQLSQAQGLEDLRDRVAALQFDIAVGVMIYNSRSHPMSGDHLLNFFPNVAYYKTSPHVGAISVPVWGPLFIGGKNDYVHSRQVISWDDKNVLIADDRGVFSVKNAKIVDRDIANLAAASDHYPSIWNIQ
jgi:hypothetical protein